VANLVGTPHADHPCRYHIPEWVHNHRGIDFRDGSVTAFDQDEAGCIGSREAALSDSARRPIRADHDSGIVPAIPRRVHEKISRRIHESTYGVSTLSHEPDSEIGVNVFQRFDGIQSSFVKFFRGAGYTNT
jgi:hypothetical protein